MSNTKNYKKEQNQEQPRKHFYWLLQKREQAITPKDYKRKFVIAPDRSLDSSSHGHKQVCSPELRFNLLQQLVCAFLSLKKGNLDIQFTYWLVCSTCWKHNCKLITHRSLQQIKRKYPQNGKQETKSIGLSALWHHDTSESLLAAPIHRNCEEVQWKLQEQNCFIHFSWACCCSCTQIYAQEERKMAGPRKREDALPILVCAWDDLTYLWGNLLNTCAGWMWEHCSQCNVYFLLHLPGLITCLSTDTSSLISQTD